MLTKTQYNAIAKRWRYKKTYQTWERIAKYMPLCEPLFKKYFQDKWVLEVGCSCGFYGRSILKYAEKYIGIDKSEKMCANAGITLGIKDPWDSDSIIFCESPAMFFTGYLNGDCSTNAFFDMVTMYSYSDKDVKAFENKIVPEISTAIIVMKEYERRPRRLYNSFEYHKSEVVRSRLEALGMRLVEDIYANKHKNRIMVFQR